MDSMTAEKAQWLREKMKTLKDCFDQLIEKSCHDEAVQKVEKEQFSQLYESINNTLNTYQRCKVGSLCRNFNELSTVFSDIYKSSSVEVGLKFKISHQVIPIFSVIDQEIDLDED